MCLSVCENCEGKLKVKYKVVRIAEAKSLGGLGGGGGGRSGHRKRAWPY